MALAYGWYRHTFTYSIQSNPGFVTQLYVPYVQVQHRQLGVTRLLGVRLLSVQATVWHTKRDETWRGL